MTILELLVVIAIIGMLSYLGYGAVRWLRGANVVEATTELASVMRRTEQLAAETGLMHRVVIDLDAQTYRVEVCEGGIVLNHCLRKVNPCKDADTCAVAGVWREAQDALTGALDRTNLADVI